MITTNFSKDPDGNLRYVDTVDPFLNQSDTFVREGVELVFNPGKLRARISEKLTGHDQSQALAYLERIEVLQKELEIKLFKENEQNKRDFEKDAPKREREWQKKFGKKK